MDYYYQRFWFEMACVFLLGVSLGWAVTETLSSSKYRKILIEHGAAYYTHDTGEFTVIRKDSNQ